MAYTWRLIRKQDQEVSRWPGGETTQLAIYPESGDFQSRQFKWRISKATVDQEESNFTPLPGFRRVLMVLEGQLQLEHEGHHRCELSAYEQDTFDGGWTTRSRGLASDFNLMFSADCHGELKVYSVTQGEWLSRETRMNKPEQPEMCRVFYCVAGSVEMACDKGAKVSLEAGDLLLLTEPSGPTAVEIQVVRVGSVPTKLLEARIYYHS
jgi:uncharacterized protein